MTVVTVQLLATDGAISEITVDLPPVTAGGITDGRDVNASNTGLTGAGIDPASLTTTGGTTYGTAFNGQTISGKRFTGTVSVTGSGITFSGCESQIGGANAIGFQVTGADNTFEDLTIIPTAGHSFYIGIHNSGSGTTIQRCDISGGENLITNDGPANDYLIQLNYLHDNSIVSNSSGHPDCIEVYGGSGGTISKNNINLGALADDAGINIAPFGGSTSTNNITIADNFILGGIVDVLVDLQSSGTINYLAVLRNWISGYTNPNVIGRYAALQNQDRRAIVSTAAEQAADPTAILWADNTWWACAGLSPDRTGQPVTFG